MILAWSTWRAGAFGSGRRSYDVELLVGEAFVPRGRPYRLRAFIGPYEARVVRHAFRSSFEACVALAEEWELFHLTGAG